jgi:hypothetical protein
MKLLQKRGLQMSETKQDETAGESVVHHEQEAREVESAFEAYKRKLEAAGVEVSVAADLPPENAERARKKRAYSRLREKMTRGRVVEPGE